MTGKHLTHAHIDHYAGAIGAIGAVDGDHIIIRTNGSGSPLVKAPEGGNPIPEPVCT